MTQLFLISLLTKSLLASDPPNRSNSNCGSNAVIAATSALAPQDGLYSVSHPSQLLYFINNNRTHNPNLNNIGVTTDALPSGDPAYHFENIRYRFQGQWREGNLLISCATNSECHALLSLGNGLRNGIHSVPLSQIYFSPQDFVSHNVPTRVQYSDADHLLEQIATTIREGRARNLRVLRQTDDTISIQNIRYFINGSLREGDLILIRNGSPPAWRVVHSQDDFPSGHVLNLNTPPLSEFSFEPSNLASVASPQQRANPLTATRPQPPQLEGATGVHGSFAPETSSPNERFLGGWIVGDYHFSTNEDASTSYVAVPREGGASLLGRIRELVRPRDRPQELTAVIVPVDGGEPIHVPWSQMLHAEPSLSAQQLFEYLRSRQEHGRTTLSPSSPRPPRRPAGGLDSERARRFRDRAHVNRVNVDTLAAFQEMSLQAGRDYDLARAPNGAPLIPAPLANGHFASPHHTMSKNTVLAVGTSLDNIPIYEILPPGVQPGRGFALRTTPRSPTNPVSRALKHPETEEMLRLAHQYGVRVLIDPTLAVIRSGANYNPRLHEIRMPASATALDLRHELVHAAFDHSGLYDQLNLLLSNQHFQELLQGSRRSEAENLFRNRISQNSLAETAAAAGIPTAQYTQHILDLVLDGIPLSAINESSSVAAELHSIDRALQTFRQSAERSNSMIATLTRTREKAHLYSLDWIAYSLEEQVRLGRPMTSTQRARYTDACRQLPPRENPQ